MTSQVLEYSIRLMGRVTHICILFTAHEIVPQLNVTVVEDGVAGMAQKTISLRFAS
jgi:nicotinamidase-related amidase